MNAREWKPGDVAAFTIHGGETIVGIRTSEGKWTAYAPGRDRSWINRPWDDMHGQRPLVVIDPEDREQVERLLEAMPWSDRTVDRLQTNLRTLIAPKPEEPLGLGAVVEDERGERWIRRSRDGSPWVHSEGTAFPQMWRHLTPVKVLSEGVTP